MANIFLRSPSSGGWLTIVNCVFWAVFFLNTRGHVSLPSQSPFLEALCIASAITFSLPLALVCLMPNQGVPPGYAGVIATALIFGVNSILWGYGLALIGRAGSRLAQAITGSD